MELLTELEQKIGALLERIDALAAENAFLKNTQEDALSALAQENSTLQAELEKERNRNSEALTRVEALIKRIGEYSVNE